MLILIVYYIILNNVKILYKLHINTFYICSNENETSDQILKVRKEYPNNPFL